MSYSETKNYKIMMKPSAYKWVMFALVFFTSLWYSHYLNISEFCFDSNYYWTISDAVYDDGFHIMMFPETFRGYFFSMIAGGFKRLFHGAWGWYILVALMLAIFFSFVIPYILTDGGLENRTDLIRSIIAYGVYMWIWGGFMQYPLSDFPAALFFVGGIALIKSIRIDDTWFVLITKSIGSGALFYAAYNTRVVYLYGLIVVVLIYGAQTIQKNRELLVSFLAFIIGITIIALPQCFINQRYVGVFSPRVYTEQSMGYEEGLQTRQVFWGLMFDRVEGYIGDSEQYPSELVHFNDSTGMELIGREGLTEQQFTLYDFLRLVRKYPADMVSIYARHLISAMTPIYRSIYVRELYTEKLPIVIVSVLIWLISFVSISVFDRKSDNTGNYVLGVIVPCLLQMAGAVEVRFFLPLYLLAYYYVFVVVDYRGLWVSLKGKRIHYTLLLGFIIVLWLAVLNNIMNSNYYRILLIDDYFNGWYAR